MSNSFTFDFSGLQNFDDAVTKDFNLQLQKIVSDCRKRPSCNEARSINLNIEALPSENDADDVIITCIVSSKIPAAKQLQMTFD